jgi:protein SCO1/2
VTLSTRTLWRGLLALASLLLLALLLVLPYPRFFPTYQPFGTRLLPPKAAYDFNLRAQGGKNYRLSDFKGKVVLIFFGYANCPDICPLTMLELARVYQALSPSEQARVQVLMITTDPKRDTPELIGRYVKAFDPSFIGLTGDPETIAAAAKAYGVGYFTESGESPEGYLVAHTAAVFLVNPKGQLELIYSRGKTAQTERMVQEVHWVLSRR